MLSLLSALIDWSSTLFGWWPWISDMLSLLSVLIDWESGWKAATSYIGYWWKAATSYIRYCSLFRGIGS